MRWERLIWRRLSNVRKDYKTFFKKKLAEHEEMIKRQAEGTDLQKLRDEAEQKIKAAEEAKQRAEDSVKTNTQSLNDPKS